MAVAKQAATNGGVRIWQHCWWLVQKWEGQGERTWWGVSEWCMKTSIGSLQKEFKYSLTWVGCVMADLKTTKCYKATGHTVIKLLELEFLESLSLGWNLILTHHLVTTNKPDNKTILSPSGVRSCLATLVNQSTSQSANISFRNFFWLSIDYLC